MNKVLIVDDNRRMLTNLSTLLFKFRDEFEVITAGSGKNAVAVLKEERIDLVITDLVMPEMDGLSLLAHIHEFYPRTLCIAMTGYSTDHIANMLPDNLLYFMKKPFKIYELVSIIKKSLKDRPPAGTVGGISIPSFFQLIEMDEKSCALDVTLSGNKKGTFMFKKGVLHDAFFENLTGEEAVIRILQSDEKAVFTFNPLPQQDVHKCINSRIKELLLKAAWRQDECAFSANQGPLPS